MGEPSLATDNNLNKATFEEISEQAREKELLQREKEKQLNEEIARKRAQIESNGKAQQQVEHDELQKVHDELYARYQASEYNKPYLGNYKPKEGMSEKESADENDPSKMDYEYEMLVRGAYSKLFDPDKGVIKELEAFLSLDVTSSDEMKTHEHKGQKQIRHSIKAMNECIDKIEKSLIYTKSKDDKEPLKLLTDLYDLKSTIERNYYGRLFVPADSVKYDENGKKIHRVVQKKQLKDPKNPEAGEEWVQPQISSEILNGFDNQRAFAKLGTLPLFDHAPNETDVQQGQLGNCYMVSSLSAFARQCPDFIRENMCFNWEDQTVTVRFFTKSQEPVYVTMDYSLPIWSETDEDGTRYRDVPYSQRAIWVALYEKAFVLSGLATDELSKAEKGTLNATYEKIRSGNEIDFLRMATGKYGHYDLYNDGVYNDNLQIGNDIQKRSMEHLAKGKDKYTYDELEVYQNIANALADDKFVTAGTQRNEKYKNSRFAGLTFGHAYAVTGASSENGKYYIQIRNPHGTRGRTYDEKGNPIEQPDVDGFSKLELHDFVKTFHDYTIAKNDVSYLNRAQQAGRDDMRYKYGKMVKLINSVLDDHDNKFMSKFKNSEQFNDFRTAARQAAAFCRYENVSAEEIRGKIQNLIDKAKIYKEYRDNNPKKSYNDKAKRSVNRYEMAAFVCEMGKVFEKMEAPDSKVFDEVTPDEIIKSINKNGMGASKAAKAAFDHFKENYHPQVENKAPEVKKPEEKQVLPELF